MTGIGGYREAAQTGAEEDKEEDKENQEKGKRELKKLKRKGEKLRIVEAEAGHTDENFANDGL